MSENKFLIDSEDWSKLDASVAKHVYTVLDSKRENELASDNEDAASATLAAIECYFVRYNGYGYMPITPLNLGVYCNDQRDLFSSQYVGIMPLVNKTASEMIPNQYINIRSRFHLSPVEMLNEIINGMDYYENPKLLTYRELTLSELLKLKKHETENEKILFGILKGTPKVNLPKTGMQGGGHEATASAVFSSTQSVFEVLQFISLARELCKKALKKQSQPVEENLNGKVKGRILIHKQIKYNLSTGQFHKSYCAYNSMEDNITENRIIKYTLYLCSKFPIAEALNDDITFCNKVLGNVPLVKCSSSDFIGLKNNGAFRQYKEVLAMAKRLLDKFFLSYETDRGTGEVKERLCSADGALPVEPYFIDMNLLFEYYCRALFRKAVDAYNSNVNHIRKLYLEPALSTHNSKRLFCDDVLAGYFMSTYIPDLVVRYQDSKDVLAVIDAKYSNLEQQSSQKRRERTHQVLFYMNVLNCNFGGLIGYEAQRSSNTAIISQPYLYDGDATQPREKTLFFIPIFPTDQADSLSPSAQYCNAIQDFLRQCVAEDSQRAVFKRCYEVLHDLSQKDYRDGIKKSAGGIYNELLSLLDAMKEENKTHE